MDLFGDKVKEARLTRFGCVQRRKCGFIGQRMLKMGLPCRGNERDHREVLWI